MTETPISTPEHTHRKKYRLPHSNHTNLPPELIRPSPKDSDRRGQISEKRVRDLITGLTDIVENVFTNEPNDSEDINGHDLTIILKNNPLVNVVYDNGKSGKDSIVITNDSPIRVLYVQVKSRREAITAYKRRIRDKYFADVNGKTDEEKDELVKRWLTQHGIILINGSQRKSDTEIFEESFYPQLQRIQKDTRRRQNTEKSGQMELFRDISLIQIFPSAVLDESLNLQPRPNAQNL